MYSQKDILIATGETLSKRIDKNSPFIYAVRESGNLESYGRNTKYIIKKGKV
ncbi:MAG: hypothetical protein H7A23_17305 [Leptospiraceae bacterium]|nr:hypothetical protein [Leptospiraceae bacterium]MCP5496306.1 hypothetical protein [Leptospiraceae bacterium]